MTPAKAGLASSRGEDRPDPNISRRIIPQTPLSQQAPAAPNGRAAFIVYCKKRRMFRRLEADRLFQLIVGDCKRFSDKRARSRFRLKRDRIIRLKQ